MTDAERSAAERSAFQDLQAYTLARGDRTFIHQHVVDAWTAQHADERTKPIALAFALIGLYLHVEKGRTGRRIQRVHVALAKRKRAWPSFPLPAGRGAITAGQVMEAAAGTERDRAIDAWSASVWVAFRGSRPAIEALLAEAGVE